MLPKGADKWKGKINKEIEITFDTPGFYGYQCKPHANMGMIGLIVVNGDGKLDNLEDAKGVKQRGKAKKAWKKLWEEADAAGLTS
jgi:pseudoazurin